MQAYKLSPSVFLRVATKDDVEEILPLVVRGTSEDTPYEGIVMDKEYLKSFVQNLVEDPTRSVVVLLVNEEKIVGFISGIVSDVHPVFRLSRIATEIFWYVVPEFRGEYSQKLIEAYEEWGRVVGCKYAQLVHFHSTPKLGKVYEARGYKPLEVAYMKEL